MWEDGGGTATYDEVEKLAKELDTSIAWNSDTEMLEFPTDEDSLRRALKRYVDKSDSVREEILENWRVPEPEPDAWYVKAWKAVKGFFVKTPEEQPKYWSKETLMKFVEELWAQEYISTDTLVMFNSNKLSIIHPLFFTLLNAYINSREWELGLAQTRFVDKELERKVEGNIVYIDDGRPTAYLYGHKPVERTHPLPKTKATKQKIISGSPEDGLVALEQALKCLDDREKAVHKKLEAINDDRKSIEQKIFQKKSELGLLEVTDNVEETE